MTLTEILQDIERRLDYKAGTITGTTALKTSFINQVNDKKYEVETLILNSADEFDYDDSNHTDFPIVTTPLTTSRDYRITVSERVLKIKRMDVTYDGVNYYKATPIDSAEMESFGLGNEDHVDQHFDKTAPRYDLKYGSWFIYPRASATDVASGAEALIEWTREGTQFETDGTDDAVEPGFDRPFHSLIPKKVALENLAIKKGNRSNTQINVMLADIAKQEDLLAKHYGHKQQDRRLSFGTVEKIEDYS
jgi:hypothetical protein